MNDEDLQIDNILDNHVKKKKVDGKAKGDRTELNLCKMLTKHFGVEFSKALGSGARWSQVNHLPEHAKKTLTGDICVPEHFLWVMESKGGYEDDMNLNNVCDGKGIACLDGFIEQVSRDAKYCGRKPIICWKRNRKPWLAFVREEDLFVKIGHKNPTVITEIDFQYRIHYREWVMVKLDDLLNGPRSYWFKEEK